MSKSENVMRSSLTAEDDLLRDYPPTAESLPDLGPCVIPSAERPAMVDFEKRDGSREAYHIGILGLVEFTPGAKQRIALHFGSAEVQLTGTNLLPLYEAILRQRVSRVTERDKMTTNLGALPFVESINPIRTQAVRRTTT